MDHKDTRRSGVSTVEREEDDDEWKEDRLVWRGPSDWCQVCKRKPPRSDETPAW